jgi:DNA-binding transcriptional MocR family regulator
LLRRSIKAGVAFVPGDRFYVGEGEPDTARLSIGSIKIELIRRGIEVLGNIIRAVTAGAT